MHIFSMAWLVYSIVKCYLNKSILLVFIGKQIHWLKKYIRGASAITCRLLTFIFESFILKPLVGMLQCDVILNILYKIFVSFGNPTWLLGAMMLANLLKFQKSSSLKPHFSHLGLKCYSVGMFLILSSKKKIGYW